jgi:hypothetical protein
MTITHHKVEQGSDEWLALRCGILTASEFKLILTPTRKVAKNDKQRAHVFEILAQRITNYTEPQHLSDAMLRGHEDEITMRDIYSDNYHKVDESGFFTNEDLGFTIGGSPDGLVGMDGIIECKSRCQKYQIQTILDDDVPAEYMLQIQGNLLVTGRKWCDFVSYCGGMHMVTRRVFRDDEIITDIVEAATGFEAAILERQEAYNVKIADKSNRLIKTERIELELEIVV